MKMKRNEIERKNNAQYYICYSDNPLLNKNEMKLKKKRDKNTQENKKVNEPNRKSVIQQQLLNKWKKRSNISVTAMLFKLGNDTAPTFITATVTTAATFVAIVTFQTLSTLCHSTSILRKILQ